MKELINNLRDYAELAQASYFNFMYINNDEREIIKPLYKSKSFDT